MKKYCIKVKENNVLALNAWLLKYKWLFPEYRHTWKVEFAGEDDDQYFHFGCKGMVHTTSGIMDGYNLIDGKGFETQIYQYKFKDTKYQLPFTKMMDMNDPSNNLITEFSANSPCEQLMKDLMLESWFDVVYSELPFEYQNGYVYFKYKHNVSLHESVVKSNIKEIRFTNGDGLFEKELKEAKIWVELNQ